MWRIEKTHSITGDEPHYLVIADGLLPTFELEQTGPYTREFQNRTIVAGGLAAKSASPTPSNTHAEIGPHGLFNVHNIGLPALLSIPYLLGGEIGARFAMIAMGALAIFLILKMLSLSGISARGQAAIAVPLCIALPFVSGATQIYPDLPGGALCLLGVYMLFRGPQAQRRRDGLFASILLAYLPWLHIRFALPMMIILISLAFTWRKELPIKSLVLRFAVPAFISLVLLATYNTYAFGHASGPYQSGDVMLNRIAIMQFFGLIFDQNQGIFLQQPLHFVGLYYLVHIGRKKLVATLTSLFVVLSLIGPNATHWNLYGGWSFSGRFGWAAATVLCSITALAAAQLWSEHKRTAQVLLSLSFAVQLRHLIAIFVQRRILFPHIFDGWIGTYSTFWSKVEAALPQWRDYRWAFSYTPNFLFICFAVAVLVIGAVSSHSSKSQRTLLLSCTATLVLLLSAYSRFGDLPFPQQRWAASQLSSSVGKVENLSRVANNGDPKGLLTYGPYWEVPSGQYEVGIRYKTDGVTDINGIIDVYVADRNTVVTAVDLPNTHNESQELFFPINISSKTSGKIELRTTYEGKGLLLVDWVQLRRTSDNIAE